MVLGLVGDPDQARFGGGQQEGADRAVDGAVGDVEDAVLLGRGGKVGVQAAQVCLGVGGVWEGPLQDLGQVVGAHGFLLTVVVLAVLAVLAVPG